MIFQETNATGKSSTKSFVWNILAVKSLLSIFCTDQARPVARKSMIPEILQNRSVFFFDLDLSGSSGPHAAGGNFIFTPPPDSWWAGL
jgi:hypothetical protein